MLITLAGLAAKLRLYADVLYLLSTQPVAQPPVGYDVVSVRPCASAPRCTVTVFRTSIIITPANG